MICNKCGAVLPDGAKFCGICGNKISALPTQSAFSEQTVNGSISKREIATQGNNSAANSRIFDISAETTELLQVDRNAPLSSYSDDTEIVHETPDNNMPQNQIKGNQFPGGVNRYQPPVAGETILSATYTSRKLPIKAVAIIISVALLCISAIIIAVLLLNSNPETKLDVYLTNAAKYLVEMNYEQAIIEFDKILEIDPMNVEAYLGKARAYYAMGDVDKAIETLKDGYEKTGDDRIWKLLTEYDNDFLTFPDESFSETIDTTPDETTSETIEALPVEPDYEITTTSYARIVQVSDGYIVASDESNGLWYFIDANGVKLSETGYKYIESFVGTGDKAYALATTPDDRDVLINSKFQEVMDLSDKSNALLFNQSNPLVLCWHISDYADENDKDVVEILKTDGTQVYSWKENEGISGGGVSILDDVLTPDSIKNYKCDTEYHENLWVEETSSSIYGGVYYNSELDRAFISYNISADYEYDHTAEEAAWAAEDEARRQAIANGGIWSTAHNTHGHYTYDIQTYEISFTNGKIKLIKSPRIAADDNNSTIDFGVPSPKAGLHVTLTKGETQSYLTSSSWDNSQTGDIYTMYSESLFVCSIKKNSPDDAAKYALFKPKWYESSEKATRQLDSEWQQLSEWYDNIFSLDKDTGTFLVSTNNRWGYIDIYGKEIAMFEDATDFSGGFAIVCENGRGRVINVDFQQIGEDFECESSHSIGKGIFAVKNGDTLNILKVKP